MTADTSSTALVLSGLDDIRPWMEDLYRHLHAHPELSMAEHATAQRIVDEVRGMPGGPDLEVLTGIGGPSVCVLVENGDGPTVLLRADTDALPVEEDTGLDYASRVRATNHAGESVPVMHACGHDTHVATLLAALRLLLAERGAWSGTLVAVFQPAEEQFNGAEAMVVDRVPADRVPADQEDDATGDLPSDVLVVMSKLKAYIKARSGLRTSDGVSDPLSEHLRKICAAAIRSAAKNERTTVLGRDIEAALRGESASE